MNTPSFLRSLSYRLKMGGSRRKKEAAARLDVGHLFERRDIDVDALAREATTRFERVYYRHQGRIMFKWSHYLKTYDLLLSPFVGQDITLVEIGLAGGGSLELWREYLGPQINLIGIDCEPGCKIFEGERTKILIGDQGDREFLENAAEFISKADIIIDDGSHINEHQIKTFEALFCVLKEGGVYICEDLHTSYWSAYGGGLRKEGSFIEYVKTLIDRMHYAWGVGEIDITDASQNIERMVITDSLVAFHKRGRRQPFMAWVGSDVQVT